MVYKILWAILGVPMVLQNHGHMCMVEIESRFSTNDLNGSRKSINTPHPFHSSSHLNLILHSLSGSICFLPESESGSNLAGTFCKYSFAFFIRFSVKVKLRLTFCINQFMVNAKFV
ncbi:hypothetical protein Hanom_Chr16g01457861 [Helianthus anomalus]